MLTIVGEPVLGAIMTSVLLLTVRCRPPPPPRPRSCRPLAAPWRWRSTRRSRPGSARCTRATRPRVRDAGDGRDVDRLLPGPVADQRDALADSIASLGLAVAFYYGITAFACVVYFRRTLFTSARHFFLRGLLPLLGGLGMVAAFVLASIQYIDPENS